MTTLVTILANSICVVTSLENASEAYEIHNTQTESALIGAYDDAEEIGYCELGKKVDFTTYVNGKYSYEGYFEVTDHCYWDYADHHYVWSIRIKGIDYDVEDDLVDEEEEDWG